MEGENTQTSLNSNRLTDDVHKLVDDLIKNSSADKPITKEQINDFKSKTNLFGIVVPKTESWINISVLNLRDEYYRKLHVTALIGYLFRVVGEFEDYIYDPKLEEQGVSREVQQSLFKRQLEAFVRRHFDFNPDIHVRSASSDDVGDPSREGKFKEMREKMSNLGVKSDAKSDEKSDVKNDDKSGVKSDEKSTYDHAKMCKIAETVPDEESRKLLMAYLNEINDTSCAVYTAANTASENIKSAIKSLEHASSLTKTITSEFTDALSVLFGDSNKIPQDRAMEILKRGPEILTKYVDAWLKGPELSPEDANVILRRCNLRLDNTIKSLSQSMHTIGTLANVRGAYTWIPPANVFHHFDRYLSNHYEQLREAVHILYNDKSDIEFAICYHDHHANEAEANNWRIMHQNKITTGVFNIRNGKWTLLGPFKENRDRIDFYNKNTEIIKRMLEQAENDQRLGADIMKKRVVEQKRKNILESGPDNPQLEAYRQAVGTIESLSVKKVLTREEKAKLEEAVRVKEDAEVPENAIQVDYFGTDKEGNFVKNKFYTQSEAPTYLSDQLVDESRRKKGLPPISRPAPLPSSENMPEEDPNLLIKRELPIVPDKKIISSKGEVTTLSELKKKFPPKGK